MSLFWKLGPVNVLPNVTDSLGLNFTAQSEYVEIYISLPTKDLKLSAILLGFKFHIFTFLIFFSNAWGNC